MGSQLVESSAFMWMTYSVLVMRSFTTTSCQLSRRTTKLIQTIQTTSCLLVKEFVGKPQTTNPSYRWIKKEALNNWEKSSLTRRFVIPAFAHRPSILNIVAFWGRLIGYSQGHNTKLATDFQGVRLQQQALQLLMLKQFE